MSVSRQAHHGSHLEREPQPLPPPTPGPPWTHPVSPRFLPLQALPNAPPPLKKAPGGSRKDVGLFNMVAEQATFRCVRKTSHECQAKAILVGQLPTGVGFSAPPVPPLLALTPWLCGRSSIPPQLTRGRGWGNQASGLYVFTPNGLPQLLVSSRGDW